MLLRQLKEKDYRQQRNLCSVSSSPLHHREEICKTEITIKYTPHCISILKTEQTSSRGLRFINFTIKKKKKKSDFVTNLLTSDLQQHTTVLCQNIREAQGNCRDGVHHSRPQLRQQSAKGGSRRCHPFVHRSSTSLNAFFSFKMKLGCT